MLPPHPPPAPRHLEGLLHAIMLSHADGSSPKLLAWMEATVEQPLAVFTMPAEYHKRMRTTNGLERYHQEPRRRSRVIRILPNRASCLRLSSALAADQSQEWLTGHRYLGTRALEEQPETADLPMPQPIEVPA